jgi:hypothetical protein
MNSSGNPSNVVVTVIVTASRVRADTVPAATAASIKPSRTENVTALRIA